ncbi:conserved hypothetical protein [Ricinus communis]|uniref:Uncharacterized protein n=1 Tax=Ricinus communis TaxID=3988 RepID=B9SEJ9_RICCO|nr:conserved hypothetical protein [Ricinus communis]
MSSSSKDEHRKCTACGPPVLWAKRIRTHVLPTWQILIVSLSWCHGDPPPVTPPPQVKSCGRQKLQLENKTTSTNC